MRRVLEANAQQQRFDVRIEPALRQPEQAPMKMQQLARVQAIVKAEVLGEKPHARASFGVAERRAEHRAGARSRRDETEQQLQRRRLAGAVRPQKAENLAARYGEG